VEKNYITTMGGLRILPDIDLKECNIKETDALILPGGETWMETIHQPILSLAKQCIEKNIIVAPHIAATIIFFS
ncbi:DJ-1/PfpI family protein, partial [Vallitalea maricola]|uniref:DJ-1/PfpI family protein n=1 Tax=Vallitalea maricola TaxID=3074433 RepID=UPI0030D94697